MADITFHDPLTRQAVPVLMERDIDLLLLEELHANPAFVAWFGAQCGVSDARFDGAWLSVSDADGETDVLLRVHAANGRVGVLIEDKVAAGEQPNQGARYTIRGERLCRESAFDHFVTCICAPKVYLHGLPPDSPYQHRVAYETIAAWFAAQTGARAQWRHDLMQKAIAQGRKGYVMVPNATVTAFHREYWERLSRTQPNLSMARPTIKGSGGKWIVVSVPGWPKTMRLNHKLALGSVELGFDRHSHAELLELAVDLPPDVLPIRTGRSGSLAIKVPVLDVTKPFAVQAAAVDAAFAAMQRLVPFATLFDANIPAAR